MNAGPDGRPTRLAAALIGGLVGASAWVSLAVVGVVDAERTTRLVAAPPWSMLAALVAFAAAAFAVVRPSRRSCAPLSLLVLPWLPVLPMPVAPAFLLWDGPLESAIWIAAMAGLVWTLWRTSRPPTPRATAPVRVRREAAAAALVAAVVTTTAWGLVRPRVPAGDEPHYLVITQSLLRDGDLRIEDNHRAGDYLAYYDGALKPDFMRRGVDRQIYSIHAPGTSALVLPGFAVAGYPGAVATVVLLSALGVAAAWGAAWRLTRDRRAAWVAALSLALSAPWLLLAFAIYPDPIGGAIVAVVVAVLVVLDTGGRLTPVRWVAVGAALAVLPWLHTRFVVVAAAAGLVLGLRGWRSAHRGRAVSALLAVPLLSAAAWFAYFQVIYGHPDPSAPYGVGTGSGWSFVPSGLAGLLFDQQFGLVANAPILGAGLLGFGTLARRHPRLAAELVALGLPYLVTAASYPMWWGGYSTPARFAIVVAPLFAVPVAMLWVAGAQRTRAVLGSVLVVSAALSAAIAGVDRGAFLFNGRDGYALVLGWLSAQVDLSLALPSVHRDGVAGAVADAAVWAVATALSVALLTRFASREWSRQAAWLATPAVVMAASTVVWARLDRPVVSAAESERRFLASWRDGGFGALTQLAPRRAVTADAVAGRLTVSSTRRGPLPDDDAPLLGLADLPAGEYDIFVDAASRAAGSAAVAVGRQASLDRPIVRWALDGRDGYGGLVLRLPVDVRSLAVIGDAEARRSVRAITLRPRRLAPAGPAPAQRAVRYGGVVVFALDEQAYLEPDALWVRGHGAAAFVVAPDDGVTPRLRVKAGAVANDIELTSGTWRMAVSLSAGEERDVDLPVEARSPAVLTIISRGGFRPSALGPSDDVRDLGVYVTWPAAGGR